MALARHWFLKLVQIRNNMSELNWFAYADAKWAANPRGVYTADTYAAHEYAVNHGIVFG